jgi:hypothetical protein
MITPGGEEAFVGKMVTESVMLGRRCRYAPLLLLLPDPSTLYIDGIPPCSASSHLSQLL